MTFQQFQKSKLVARMLLAAFGLPGFAHRRAYHARHLWASWRPHRINRVADLLVLAVRPMGLVPNPLVSCQHHT
jgi:hypothetical protein